MRKVVRRRIRRDEPGFTVVADVNVVIAMGESGTTRTSSSVHQRAGRPPEPQPQPREAPDQKEVQ